MVLIRRAKILVFLIIAVAAVVVSGVASSRTVNAVVAGSVERKVGAERTLYVAFLGAAIVSGAAVWLLMDHIRFLREISSAAGMVRREGNLPTGKLKRLGSIGTSIQRLFGELAGKNEALARRIDAQRQLVTFLVENSRLSAAIVDARGVVAYANEAFINKSRRARASVLGAGIEAVLPDVAYEDVVTTLDRTGELLQDDAGRGFYPITDERGILNYVVVVWNASDLKAHSAARQMTTKPRKSLGDRMRRLFGRSAG